MFRLVGLWKYTPARDRSGRYESDRGLETFWVNSSFGTSQHQGSPGSPGLLHRPPSCSAGSSHPCLCLHLAELELGSHCRWEEQGTLTTLSQTSWRVWPIRPQNSHHTHTGVWLKATEAGQSDFRGQEPLTSSVPKPPGCQSTHPVSTPGGGKPQGPGRISAERSSWGRVNYALRRSWPAPSDEIVFNLQTTPDICGRSPLIILFPN